MTTLVVDEDPKMLRESLCAAQAALAQLIRFDRIGPATGRRHIARLQVLIGECDRHRPLGPDGKHGGRHTATCGCEDVGVPVAGS